MFLFLNNSSFLFSIFSTVLCKKLSTANKYYILLSFYHYESISLYYLIQVFSKLEFYYILLSFNTYIICRNMTKFIILPIRIVKSNVSSVGPSLANARNLRLCYTYQQYTNVFLNILICIPSLSAQDTTFITLLYILDGRCMLMYNNQ